MSLSRYFSNSSLFKREEIVKQVQAEFVNAKPLPSKEEQQRGTETESPPKTAPTKESSAPPQAATPAAAPAPPPPPKPDLSKYVPKEQVQRQNAEAHDKGFKEGYQKAQDEFLAATKALLSACQQIDSLRETLIANSTEEIKTFALAVSERILRLSLATHRESIIATIDEALQRAVKSDEFFIYVHPEDYELVQANAEDLVAGVTGLNHVVIKKDASIERGGAKLESENCTIDATVASQLEALSELIQRDS